ncbi:MAG: hypothetical protein ACUVSY_07475 [Roseiflexus sp.]
MPSLTYFEMLPLWGICHPSDPDLRDPYSNDGRGEAGGITVVCPHNRDHILPIADRFDRRTGDRMSGATPNRPTITFGRLGGSKMRGGFVDFKVNDRLTGATRHWRAFHRGIILCWID